MPQKIRNYLASIGPRFDVSTAALILKEIRILSERRGVPLGSMTKLITDWSVHAKLDRKSAKAIVEAVSLETHDAGGQNALTN